MNIYFQSMVALHLTNINFKQV